MVNFNKWIRQLKYYGITADFVESERKLLSTKFGQDASDQDILWGLFNKSVLQNSNDFSTVKQIYYDMALFLNEIGKDPFNCLKNSAKFGLFSLKQSGIVKKVRILVATDSWLLQYYEWKNLYN
jgi:hypothetical protein